MDTNQIGDFSEQAVILKSLENGWRASQPIGNRLPYDLILDISTRLDRIQVKTAWLDEASQNYLVDNRRTKTNRRKMLREPYSKNDFDFAIIYVPQLKIFYVMPVADFVKYGSTFTIVDAEKRQRKPRSAAFREAWKLLEQE